MFRYYSIMRPVQSLGYPKQESVEKIHNFNTKIFCEEIGREAWGYIDYSEDLTKEEAKDYELMLGGMKTYWCVTTSIDDRGRVVSNITNTIEAVCKPEDSSMSTKREDIYNDWFESREEAEKWVEEARQA